MSGSKGSYQRARRAAIKAGTWNPRGSGASKQNDAAGGKKPAKMDIHDARQIDLDKKAIKSMQGGLPSFIKGEMTREQISTAVIAELQKKEYDLQDNADIGNKKLKLGSITVSRLDINARFRRPQDEKFIPLTAALSAPIAESILYEMARDMRFRSDYDRTYYPLRNMVEQACSRYTTRELTQFLSQELHTTSRANRNDKISTIAMLVHQRHYDRGTGKWRTSLDEPSPRLLRAVGSAKQTLDNISYRQSRIRDIETKYKSNARSTNSQSTTTTTSSSSPISREIARRAARREAEIRRRTELSRQRSQELRRAAERDYQTRQNQGNS